MIGLKRGASGAHNRTEYIKLPIALGSFLVDPSKNEDGRNRTMRDNGDAKRRFLFQLPDPPRLSPFGNLFDVCPISRCRLEFKHLRPRYPPLTR